MRTTLRYASVAVVALFATLSAPAVQAGATVTEACDPETGLIGWVSCSVEGWLRDVVGTSGDGSGSSVISDGEMGSNCTGEGEMGSNFSSHPVSGQ